MTNHLIAFILACLATAATLLVMPLLTDMERHPTPSSEALEISTIHWQKPKPQASRTCVKPLPLPPPPADVDIRPSSSMLSDIPRPQPATMLPSLPKLSLTPTVLPPVTVPDLPFHYAVKQLDTQSVNSSSTASQTASGIHSGTGSFPALPPQAPLAEKILVKPRFPRNAPMVNGSIELEFMVEPDGTVSHVTVIHCDPQLSFKYRREAVRAAQQSRYFPAIRLGVPVSVRATRRIDFIVP